MYLVGNNGEDRVVAVLRQARAILARHGAGTLVRDGLALRVAKEPKARL